MPKTVMFGSVGTEVKLLQAKLNSVLGAVLQLPLAVDGIFGAKTAAAVKIFQGQNRLIIDGIVGPLSWAALDAYGKSKHQIFDDFCSCGETASVSPSHFVGLSNRAAVGGSFPTTAGLPSLNLRPVPDKDKKVVEPYYGDSIDYSTVYMTDLKAGSRAFVTATLNPLGGRAYQVINIGSTYDEFRLVHEMGHVWQSQHHANQLLFMANSIASRAMANTLNAINFGKTAYYAYAYIEGRSFSSYGAEQLAQAIASGNQGLINHAKSLAKNVVDPELNLKDPRAEDYNQNGVKLGGFSSDH